MTEDWRFDPLVAFNITPAKATANTVKAVIPAKAGIQV
jgi:hypothetical protein